MRRKIQKLLGTFIVLSATSLAAQAGVDQYKVSGYVTYSWSLQSSINLYIDGTGVNQTVHLYASSGRGVDYKYWGGVVPNDAVLVEGVSGIKIYVDTCTVRYNDGCGLIDVTIKTEPGYYNFLTYTGVTQYQYDNGTIITNVGNWQYHYTTTTGTINGVPIDIQAPNGLSTLSKATNLSVTVTTE